MAQQIFGRNPTKLPAGRSIYRITGNAMVNGKPATLETPIGPAATVETGKDSEIIYVSNQNAYILRANSQVVLEAAQSDSLATSLKLLTGKLLSVFAKQKSPFSVRTNTATIGVRGTGVYLEADPEQTYFCTCYGIADVEAINDPQSKETVIATQHDKPLYILAGGQAGKNIRRAPFINHTDQELSLIEALVGRTPPFVFPKEDYSGPRRDY